MVCADSIPPWKELMNYPHVHCQREKNGYKTCAMCGQQTRFKEPQDTSSPYIGKNDKVVCSTCQAQTWVVICAKVQIKWCTCCYNFCTKVSFVARTESSAIAVGNAVSKISRGNESPGFLDISYGSKLRLWWP